MSTTLSILAGTPVYVWLILAAVLALAARSLTRRTLAPVRLLPLPMIMFAVALAGLARQADAGAAALAAWFAAFLAGLSLGAYLASLRTIAAGGRPGHVEVGGDAVTFGLILASFAVHYAFGVAQAMASSPDASLRLIEMAASGLLGGVFLGRGLASFRRAARIAARSHSPA